MKELNIPKIFAQYAVESISYTKGFEIKDLTISDVEIDKLE
jgi:hypothetical protein